MKKIIVLIGAALFFITGFSQLAQENVDTTVRFKVSGSCGMCKERIEKSLQVKGIRAAVWDVHSKMLDLRFNPRIMTLEEVHKILAEVGHDTELEKAKKVIYDQLPECCRYREKESIHSISHDQPANSPDSGIIRGVVLEEDRNGSFKPLVGASVIWLGSNRGTMTDASGVFRIASSDKQTRIVVSFAGYRPDTIRITSMNELNIILASGKELSEVRVINKQRSTYISALDPIRTQVMTERELFKAACCNLSESFETNPSVDVSYNDAVTGSKQIQLLGLSGNYTQLTVENMPGPRGIATPLGLNSIAGPWIESIQLSKGVGSVVNGYESIAGQINIELKKPEKTEKLYANIYLNNLGKLDLNLNLSQKIGKKWSTALLLHDDFLKDPTIDFNKDGFRDLPTGNQFSAINRWKYEDRGVQAQIGFKILTDSKTGGETDFDPVKKLTTEHYGLGIQSERYEAFAKTGIIFPEKKYKSIGLQLSGFYHNQESYFGLKTYDARQQNFYSNLIYQSIIGNTNHKFRTGISFTADVYDERFYGDRYQRKELVPGGFFEYTFTPVDKINIVAGLRVDHNSLFEWFMTPRLHIRYEPVKRSVLRISAGRGQRTANILAENMGVFVSSRRVTILSSVAGKAYGFGPEIAWNKGISFDQKFRLFSNEGSFTIDYFRNDFTEQVQVDLEDPGQIRFYQLVGKSFSNSMQAELAVEPIKKLELRLAYRFFDVKSTYDNVLLQKPFTAKHRAFANVGYVLKGWKFDFTINYIGPKRISSTVLNPVEFRLDDLSPSYSIMNAQVSKTFGKTDPIDIYAGGENISNFFQKNPILSADQPFSNYFDASMVWGPVGERLIYAGFRYKLK